MASLLLMATSLSPNLFSDTKKFLSHMSLLLAVPFVCNGAFFFFFSWLSFTHLLKMCLEIISSGKPFTKYCKPSKAAKGSSVFLGLSLHPRPMAGTTSYLRHAFSKYLSND